eukprot:GHRR01028830.1.p1 GENE.GHRR01028830.1~~GHRR01028830.1.p1  ORF type:complete len:187 (+),score=27.57 GHRR01028830.1:540-1100(+)
MVVGDKMLIIYQSLPLPPAPPSRQYLWLDLLTASVSFNHYMMEDVRLIDWPLIGAIQLADGSSLLLQAMRQLPNQNATNMFWYGVKGDADADGPLSWMASTTLKQLVGGTGGKVLALSLLHIHGKPNMVTWTRTNASFAQRRGNSPIIIFTVVQCCMLPGLYTVRYRGPVFLQDSEVRLVKFNEIR